MDEYAALRDELISNSQVVAQFLIMSITAAAILGFGIQSEGKNGLLFLAPFLLTIPALWFITSQVDSSVRIATYIKTVIEPEAEGKLQWETQLGKIRGPGSPEYDYMFAICTIYRIIGIACLILSIGVAARVRWEKTTGDLRKRLSEFRQSIMWFPLTILVALGVTCFVVQELALADLRKAFHSSYGKYVAQWTKMLESKKSPVP